MVSVSSCSFVSESKNKNTPDTSGDVAKLEAKQAYCKLNCPDFPLCLQLSITLILVGE